MTVYIDTQCPKCGQEAVEAVRLTSPRSSQITCRCGYDNEQEKEA